MDQLFLQSYSATLRWSFASVPPPPLPSFSEPDSISPSSLAVSEPQLNVSCMVDQES